jgi:hypothetical protein
MKRGRTTRAFTLLELLVAASLTLIVTVAMVSVSTGALTVWRSAQAAQNQAAAARQVFDLLEQDLHSAVRRRDALGWLAVDVLDNGAGLANHGWLLGPGLMKPAQGDSLRLLPAPEMDGRVSLAEARFGLSGCWLRFVAANVEAGGTLPTVVAYQLARRPVTGDPVADNRAPVRYSLYRSAVANDETLARGYDVTAPAYASTDNRPSNALSSAYRQARNVTNPSHANLVAANVVDFGLWLYVRNSDGSLRRIFPATAADLSHRATGNGGTDDTAYPEVVDVLLRVVSEAGAARLAAIEGNTATVRPPGFTTDAEWWWAVALQHSRVFVQRIELKGMPP